MRIGEVARRTGCHIETIRYYEKAGILAAPARRGTYRDYTGSDVERLRFVRRARELGFSLDEIRTLLDLASRRQVDCAHVLPVAARHLANVREKLADLARIEAALCDLVSQCSEGAAVPCPVVRSLAGGEPPAAASQ